ncbi:MAG: dihydrodipicolinate synthase family protein [Opitutaceae bacterium]|nr:dihydrodipicolinate synthase family protein [Opitutaceae bacterium]
MPPTTRLDSRVRELLFRGIVIPAHPLALDRNHRFDHRRQRALTRYYLDAGAKGIAVGVHTTQFEIRQPEIGLFKPVLELGVETIREHENASGDRIVKVAGVVGNTSQAMSEAEFARELGYDLALVSLGAFPNASNVEMIDHLRRLSSIIPVFGFYLQPAVGGRRLDYEFWKAAMEIESLVAVKVAPFNRYDSLDVARAIGDAGRADSVALYTGNDDNILLDLLTPMKFGEDSGATELRFRGGLFGQWAVWTRKAVEDLRAIHEMQSESENIPSSWLTRAQQLTDANAAIFDVANGFAGCITGIHEVLRRQGLLEGIWTLNEDEGLSPGQSEAIDRVCASYPSLMDDVFVAENLDRWLS